MHKSHIHSPVKNICLCYHSGGAGHQDDQTLPNMTAGVFEAKYELDSLAGTWVGPIHLPIFNLFVILQLPSTGRCLG